jgi:hypothetical protein
MSETVEHIEIEETRVKTRSVAPSSAPVVEGEMYVLVNSDSKCIFVSNGTTSANDFVVVAFTPRTYSGDPNGIVESRCENDLTIDNSTFPATLYYSPAANGTQWEIIGGSDSSGGGGQ